MDDYKGKTVTVPAWLFDEVAGFWFKHKAKVDREPGVPYNDDGSDSSEEDEGLPVNEGQDEETNGEPGPSE